MFSIKTTSKIMAIYLFSFVLLCRMSLADENGQKKVFPGAHEKTPSKSQYCSWINNTNEGSTQQQTLTNIVYR